VFDKYIYLFMSALNKALPRRVIFITDGFGSLLVRVLFLYKVINIKWAIVLAFILPFMSFAFFLAFLLLPLYLSGTYPNSFGKFFFRFLKRFASKEGFSVLIREHHTDGKYLPVVYKPGKYLPVIQKRGYRATLQLNSTFQEVVRHLAEIYPISNARHLAYVEIIVDALKISLITGEWPEMRRHYPLLTVGEIVEQARLDPKKAEFLANQVITRTGPFAEFRFPEGAVHLV
jgi:hypothetical protein